MNKPQRFKQPNPQYQMISVVGALEGNLSNFEEKIVGEDAFIRHVRSLINDLYVLREYMPLKWPEDKNDE